MTTDFGSEATSAKSFGVKVIPMESMRAAKPAVKYFVVNQAKSVGLSRPKL
jgi:hypothetical protein